MEATPDPLALHEDGLFVVHEPLTGGLGERLGVVQQRHGVQGSTEQKDPAGAGDQPCKGAVGAMGSADR